MSSAKPTIPCPYCGEYNDSDRHFCWICRSLLEELGSPALELLQRDGLALGRTGQAASGFDHALVDLQPLRAGVAIVDQHL